LLLARSKVATLIGHSISKATISIGSYSWHAHCFESETVIREIVGSLRFYIHLAFSIRGSAATKEVLAYVDRFSKAQSRLISLSSSQRSLSS
jgi:hypothetical protein